MLFFSRYNPIIQSKTLKIRLSSLSKSPQKRTKSMKRPMPCAGNGLYHIHDIEYIGLGAEKHTISISNEVMPIET